MVAFTEGDRRGARFAVVICRNCRAAHSLLRELRAGACPGAALLTSSALWLAPENEPPTGAPGQ